MVALPNPNSGCGDAITSPHRPPYRLHRATLSLPHGILQARNGGVSFLLERGNRRALIAPFGEQQPGNPGGVMQMECRHVRVQFAVERPSKPGARNSSLVA